MCSLYLQLLDNFSGILISCMTTESHKLIFQFQVTESEARNWRGIKTKSIKLLEESIGKTFSDINCTYVFLGQCPKAKEIKTKINKRDLIKLRSFYTVKETINKTRRQPTDWEKMLANNATSNGLIYKIYQQLVQLNNNNNNPNQKMSRRPKQTFLQRR